MLCKIYSDLKTLHTPELFCSDEKFVINTSDIIIYIHGGIII